MIKKKFTWRDLTINDLRVYLFSLFKAFIPKTKIRDFDELEKFIQTKSAWVSQVTLYGYLKTRMGTKWVLHFDDEKFLSSINLAKWNIYSIALQDLTFYTLSYLSVFSNFKDTDKASEIYDSIIANEVKNGMPEDIIVNAREIFNERLNKIDWSKYYKSWPFNESALALYKWAPVAEDLKTLDRKIVLNSMILKWENIEKEFLKLISI